MIFSSRMGITVKLGLLSCIITIVFGIGIGILSAVKKYTLVDYAATTFAVIFSAAPGFWVALMSMLVSASIWGGSPPPGALAAGGKLSCLWCAWR